jgi:hypothetical protein
MNAVAHPVSARKGRAARPGRSGVRGFLVVGIFAVLFAALGVGIYGLVGSHHSNNLADAASYIPKQQLDHPIDKTIVGTVSDPALTVTGLYVDVRTKAFSARVVVAGPLVPGEGLPFQARWTTCTWTVSISHVEGRVPVAVADFDSIDNTGEVYEPYLVPAQPKLPGAVTTGHNLTFQIRAVMPTGEGLMRWAPDGRHIVAKWDYQVEND